MVRFGMPQKSCASPHGGLGRHEGPHDARPLGAAHGPFGLRPHDRPEPIHAARGVTVGIMLSLPIWVGAAALLWVTL